MHFERFPEELRALSQWVCWKYVSRDGKRTKVPYQIDGMSASSTDERTWTTFDNCLANISRFDGIGFCFSIGYIGIDLDYCFAKDGSLYPWAMDVVAQFPTYTEMSPSGNGLHIILKSDVDLTGSGSKKEWFDEDKQRHGIECYGFGRYFTVTGNVYNDREILNDCDIIEWKKETFPQKEMKDQLIFPQAPRLPKDNKILSVMFSAKNGEKLKQLYLEGGERGSDDSKNDLVLVGALMFYCGNRVEDVDRLFRQSKLMREKWDRPSDNYGERTMKTARKMEIMEWKFFNEELVTNSKGYPLDNIENICITLRADKLYQGKIRMNADSGRMELTESEMMDHHVLEITAYLQRIYPYMAQVKKGTVFDAVSLLANENTVHPRADFVRGLRWDKESRLDSWISVVCGTPNDELHKAYSSNWVKGLVKRIIEPACQFDEVLVLSGVQGCGKSSVLRAWGGGTKNSASTGWHVETRLDGNNKDMLMLFRSKVIIEFAEGAALSKKDANDLKSIISGIQDTYRQPYGKLDQTLNRSCVFAMTTNADMYLVDETGNRRFLPVQVEKTDKDVCNIDWLIENREQLLAEAFYRIYTLKESSHHYPKDLLKRAQKEKEKNDEYDAPIELWFNGLSEYEKGEGITGLQVWHEVIHPEKKENGKVPIMDSRSQKWVANILRRHLKLTPKLVKIGNDVSRRWKLG